MAREPIQKRVVRLKSGKHVYEEEFVPARRFKAEAMRTRTGRGKFATVPFGSRKRGIIGCLPQDYDPRTGRCRATTLQKTVEGVTPRRASALRRRRGVRFLTKNPQLMIISNPVAATIRASEDIEETERAYREFHATAPHETLETEVPEGWPSVYVVIGELLRFEVETHGGKVVVRNYRGRGKPRLCTTADMRELYIFGRDLRIPAGRATRCDYRVPQHSGRMRWGRDWTHAHDTRPRVTPHRSGTAVRVSGVGLQVTTAGIEG